MDLSYSLGLVVNAKDDSIAQVIWDGPAFKAGLTVGSKLLAVGGMAYDADALRRAVTEAETSDKPIELLVRQGDRYRTLGIAWTAGHRYPRLEKASKGMAWLDRLLAPKK